MKKITIIMPVYNCSKKLEKTLKYIKEQTFKDFKLICVNDGSSDNSLEILENLKEQYDFLTIITQTNQGAGAARNNALKFVDTETVIFLDADDYFNPELLEKLYKQYEKTKADIVICKYDVELPDGRLFLKNQGIQYEDLIKKEVFNKYDIPDIIFNFANHAAWNKLYRTEFLHKNNINFARIPNCEDSYFTLLSLYHAEKITYINDNLITYYYCTPNSLTLQSKTRTNEYIFEMFERLKTRIVEPQFEKSFNNEYLSTIMYALNFLDGEHQKNYFRLIKKNIPLYKKQDVHKNFLYDRLLIIKKLPLWVLMPVFDIRRVIKNFFRK